MEEELRSNLIVLVDLFAARTGKSSAAIGKFALNDNTFFSRMADGGGFTVKTYDRLVRWFSNNWLPDLAWPAHIVRPRPLSQAEEAA